MSNDPFTPTVSLLQVIDVWASHVNFFMELAFQCVSGFTRTKVGYSQGNLHEPTYKDFCTSA